MSNNEFNNYLENYIANLKNVNDKPKASFFLNYLKDYSKTQLNEELSDNPDIFNILDKDFLLDSIDYYINETQPARGVAEDYRRTIIELFKAICSEYNIKNSFLESASEQREFYNITKEQFEYLRQSESRGCMTFEKFELLDEAIRNFFSTDNIEEKSKHP